MRKRHPGTGIVILTQYDEPEYAISLLSEGSAGYAYLLKDRIAEGDQLVRAMRAVATGGTMLDPAIVDSLVHTGHRGGRPHARRTRSCCSRWPRASRSRRSRSPQRHPSGGGRRRRALFLKLATDASKGREGALRRLRMLHQAIVDREEQGESLSRLLPGGLAEKLRREGRHIGETEKLVVTVLMSDIRGYSTIAEHADPSALAGAAQRAPRRDERGHPRRGRHRDAVRRRRGHGRVRRAVPAGRPRRPRRCAPPGRCTRSRPPSTRTWEAEGLTAFGLGIGISTGEVAAALLGSEERLEYTIVGDTVNLSQRLQQLADAGCRPCSARRRATCSPSSRRRTTEPALVKGRDTPVEAYRIAKRYGYE